MTCVKLSKNGFSVNGHCTVDADDEQGRQVCAAVSSAAYMAANTIIEVIGDKVKSDVSDAKMTIEVLNPSEETLVVLEGFKIHLQQMAEQFPNCIKVYLEV